MILTTLLIELLPIFGVVFFLIFAAVAFIAYKMLKKTVKMAVRMTIVVAILLIALVGSIALLMFAGSRQSSSPTKPAPTRTNR
jgi:EamA domain-containing membrane protein RarD